MRYTVPFIHTCHVKIPGAVHGFTTPFLRVEVSDTWTYGAGRHEVDPDCLQIDLCTYDLSVTFPIPESGDLHITRRA